MPALQVGGLLSRWASPRRGWGLEDPGQLVRLCVAAVFARLDRLKCVEMRGDILNKANQKLLFFLIHVKDLVIKPRFEATLR